MWYARRRELSQEGGAGAPFASARSLTEFQQAFPDEGGCASFLFERRWPNRATLSAPPVAAGERRPWIPERSATRLREADLNVLSKLGKQGLE